MNGGGGVREPRAGRGGRRAAALALVAILALAAALRVYELRDNPRGLFCDEAALGYNAYSILKCGKDENGVRFPLYVWSFGGYKNPVYIYSAIVPIALLGLDEFSLRLTSVFWGLLAVWGLYLLVAGMLDRRAGLLAALLLALSYWHIHFSRVAFELASLPALFIFGLHFLLKGIRRGRGGWWCLSALFFGSCFYAYAPSKIQVPVFLLGAFLLYPREAWRRKWWFLLAIAVFAATVFPSARFSREHRDRDGAYFRENSVFKNQSDPKKLAMICWRNYRSFLEPKHLFLAQEDAVVRHGVRGFGLYPRCCMWLSAFGLLCILVRMNRPMLLVLLWGLVYPLAASFMDEIPSNSRSFLGSPVVPIICAYGLYCVFLLTDRIRWRWVRWPVNAALLGALGAALCGEIPRYLDEYYRRYPSYSAGGIYGWQYGYRDAIRYMETQRKNYGRLMLTSASANQPYIFALFYSGIDPREYLRTGYPGYLVLVPNEYRRYSTKERVLYALDEQDLQYFSDYDVKKVVKSPDAVVQFVVAAIGARKDYITTWLTVGLFDNTASRGVEREYIDVDNFSTADTCQGRSGPVKWRTMYNQFADADFNRFYAPEANGNPENVCAYAVTYIESPAAQPARLEISGSPDYCTAWLNRRKVAPPAVARPGANAAGYDVRLAEGENELLIKTCESVGDWYLLVRLVTPGGKNIEGLTYRATPRSPAPPRPAPPKHAATREKKSAAAVQVVEGFSGIVSFANTGEKYPGVRGDAEAWWEYYRDGGQEVTWETAPCPEKKDAVFVFFGQTGEDPGKAELRVNDSKALSFDTGIRENREWREDGFVLAFRSLGYSAGNCGLYFLKVPRSNIRAGAPCRITVTHTEGGRVSWFMIKNYTDNIVREGVAADNLPPALLPEGK